MKHNPQKSLGPSLMHAARLYRARMAQALAEIGVFPGQDGLLQALAGSDGATVGDLSRALRVRPPTISKMITRLAAQGLVTRHALEGDARIVLVRLTAAGDAKLERIGAFSATMEQEIGEILGEKETKRLRKSLRRLAKGFSGQARNATEAGDDADLAPDEDEV